MKRILIKHYIIVMLFLYGIQKLGWSFSIKAASPIVVVVPGIDGKGSALVALRLFGKDFLMVETPSYQVAGTINKADLGQQQCVSLLHKKMSIAIQQAHEEKRKIILFASSQGVGTFINWCSLQHDIDTLPLAALIFEGGFISANSALSHAAKYGHQWIIRKKNSITRKYVMSLPCMTYIAPYIIQKLRFPFYTVMYEQPLHVISTLPTKIPIIIAHHIDDYTVPFSHGQALYGGLLEQASIRKDCFKAIYFIPVFRLNQDDKPCHINLFSNPGNLDRYNYIIGSEKGLSIDEALSLAETVHEKLLRNILITHSLLNTIEMDSIINSNTSDELLQNPKICKEAYHALLSYEQTVRLVPLLLQILAGSLCMIIVIFWLFLCMH